MHIVVFHVNIQILLKGTVFSFSNANNGLKNKIQKTLFINLIWDISELYLVWLKVQIKTGKMLIIAENL